MDRTSTAPDGSKTASNPDGRADNYERIRYVDEATADDEANWTGRANNRSPIVGADFVACSEADGGDDEESCDADWTYDGDLLFASGSFDCTTTRPVSCHLHLGCGWRTAVRRPQRLPPRSLQGDRGTGSNLRKNFITCTDEARDLRSI